MQQQFNRVPVSVAVLAEKLNFAIVSEASKRLKGAKQPTPLPFRLKYLQLPTGRDELGSFVHIYYI